MELFVSGAEDCECGIGRDCVYSESLWAGRIWGAGECDVPGMQSLPHLLPSWDLLQVMWLSGRSGLGGRSSCSAGSADLECAPQRMAEILDS